MWPVLCALLVFVRSLFRSRLSLQLEVLALRHQLAVYQRSINGPRLRPADRIFWSWISWGWSRWREVLVFVQPATVLAWQRKRFRDHWARISQSGTPGRPTISREVRELIRNLSSANPGWRSPRILGELRKLGIEVAKSTVEKYRVRPRKPISPTWKAFLDNHLMDLVSIDFFTVPTVRFKVLFSLAMDAPGGRPVQPPNLGKVIEFPDVRGLHHHYERLAA